MKRRFFFLSGLLGLVPLGKKKKSKRKWISVGDRRPELRNNSSQYLYSDVVKVLCSGYNRFAIFYVAKNDKVRKEHPSYQQGWIEVKYSHKNVTTGKASFLGTVTHWRETNPKWIMNKVV